MAEFEGFSKEKGLSPQKSDRNCFVVFLDIMGFKDRVIRTKHEELRNELNELKEQISVFEHKDLGKGSLIVQFSDSIIIFSKDDKIESLRSTAELSCSIIKAAMSNGFPIKGALAKGRVTCDTSKQLYFGQPIIDAFLLEENVKYYGLVVHHTAEDDVMNMGDDGLFRDVSVYLRSGQIKHYELLWYIKEDQALVREYLKEIRKKVSDEPRKYIDNTLSVMGLHSK